MKLKRYPAGDETKRSRDFDYFDGDLPAPTYLHDENVLSFHLVGFDTGLNKNKATGKELGKYQVYLQVSANELLEALRALDLQRSDELRKLRNQVAELRQKLKNQQVKAQET